MSPAATIEPRSSSPSVPPDKLLQHPETSEVSTDTSADAEFDHQDDSNDATTESPAKVTSSSDIVQTPAESVKTRARKVAQSRGFDGKIVGESKKRRKAPEIDDEDEGVDVKSEAEDNEELQASQSVPRKKTKRVKREPANNEDRVNEDRITDHNRPEWPASEPLSNENFLKKQNRREKALLKKLQGKVSSQERANYDEELKCIRFGRMVCTRIVQQYKADGTVKSQENTRCVHGWVSSALLKRLYPEHFNDRGFLPTSAWSRQNHHYLWMPELFWRALCKKRAIIKDEDVTNLLAEWSQGYIKQEPPNAAASKEFQGSLEDDDNADDDNADDDNADDDKLPQFSARMSQDMKEQFTHLGGIMNEFREYLNVLHEQLEVVEANTNSTSKRINSPRNLAEGITDLRNNLDSIAPSMHSVVSSISETCKKQQEVDGLLAKLMGYRGFKNLVEDPDHAISGTWAAFSKLQAEVSKDVTAMSQLSVAPSVFGNRS